MIILRQGIRELPYTQENIDRFKSGDNLLRHARYIPGETDGIILVKGRNLVGYIGWQGKTIIALEVTPEFRKQGYGRKLVEEAVNSGCTNLSVDPKNEEAISLYTSLGFRKTGMTSSGKLIVMRNGRG